MHQLWQAPQEHTIKQYFLSRQIKSRVSIHVSQVKNLKVWENNYPQPLIQLWKKHVESVCRNNSEAMWPQCSYKQSKNTQAHTNADETNPLQSSQLPTVFFSLFFTKHLISSVGHFHVVIDKLATTFNTHTDHSILKISFTWQWQYQNGLKWADISLWGFRFHCNDRKYVQFEIIYTDWSNWRLRCSLFLFALRDWFLKPFPIATSLMVELINVWNG